MVFAEICKFNCLCCHPFQALNKKEHKGCDSPEPIDQDPYTQALRGDEKFDRLSEDYQRVMQQNAMRVSRLVISTSE